MYGQTGITTGTAGTFTGSNFTYTIANVPAGSYYLYVLVDTDGSWGTNSGGPLDTGDYFASYGGAPLQHPASPSVTVGTSETLTNNLTLAQYTGPYTGGTATVTGTFTVPTEAIGYTYAIMVDTDLNCLNGCEAIVSGTVAGTSVSYSFSDVPTEAYYITGYIYMGTYGAYTPATAYACAEFKPGDYIGGYNIPDMESLPTSPNCFVTESVANSFNFTAFEYTQEAGAETKKFGGSIKLPAAVSDRDCIITIDDPNTPETASDGISKTVSGNMVYYGLYDFNDGTYTISCWVDVNNDGNMTLGDYYGSIENCSIPTAPNQVFNFTLSEMTE